ncbi:MAG TPA: gamma-glutamyltransferase, partial [Polyangiaceae bacterium]|nr:gamma-glutamyltransferase [Polyangiaceae bacterium]
SSMTPTIVLRDGKPVLAIGGSGGMTIPTNVTQLLLGALVFDMTPEALVDARRFYVIPRGPTMYIEAGAEPALLDDLAFRGEIVATMPFTTSAVQIVAQRTDGAHAAADPRKFGSAAVRAPRASQ